MNAIRISTEGCFHQNDSLTEEAPCSLEGAIVSLAELYEI